MIKVVYFVVSISLIVFFIPFQSCEKLQQLLPDSLSTEEVVSGLKKALELGTDSSTKNLSASNGYYGDILVKIPLPEEAQVVREQIDELSKLTGLSNVFDVDKEFEDVVKSLNKAAEAAANDAKPIFSDAITTMSISDGWAILNGINPADSLKADSFDSTAATQYFKVKTQSKLVSVYAPYIDTQLDKDLGLGFSANDAWTALRTAINTSMNKIEGNIILKPLYTASGIKINRISSESIGAFATEKALDGLFLKVGDQEKEIRRDPFKWAIDIIQKVFGSLTEKI
ncbi:MAG: DUF4197 domain-containing protein [Bacteroidales bacterium]|nr:DUF4197 domain-containing protein [Bacteroidales bacterium]